MSSSCVSLLKRTLGVRLDCEFLALTSGSEAVLECPEPRLLRAEPMLPRALFKLDRLFRGKLDRLGPGMLERLFCEMFERFDPSALVLSCVMRVLVLLLP